MFQNYGVELSRRLVVLLVFFLGSLQLFLLPAHEGAIPIVVPGMIAYPQQVALFEKAVKPRRPEGPPRDSRPVVPVAPEFLACCVATIIQVEAVLRGRSALFAWLAGFFVASAAGTAVRWLSLSAGLPWWFPFEGLGLCTLSFVLGLGCLGLHAVVRPRGAVGPRLKVKV